MKRFCVASSRWPEVGNRCREFAVQNAPEGWCHTEDPEESDVFLSVLYGSLVSEDFIARRRCYNFHPGILPIYRGAGAFSWCLINGDRACGVTLHELDVDIDTGPIICVRSFPVEAWDTAGTLFAKGMSKIYDLFCEYFHRLLLGQYHAQPQCADAARTYYRKDLRKQQDVTRFVRAFTFEGKEPAFYTDRHGNRHELRW